MPCDALAALPPTPDRASAAALDKRVARDVERLGHPLRKVRVKAEWSASHPAGAAPDETGAQERRRVHPRPGSDPRRMMNGADLPGTVPSFQEPQGGFGGALDVLATG